MDIHLNSQLLFKQPITSPELIPYLISQNSVSSFPILLEKPRLYGLNNLAQEVLLKKIKPNTDIATEINRNQLFSQQKLQFVQSDERVLAKMLSFPLITGLSQNFNIGNSRICAPLISNPYNLQGLSTASISLNLGVKQMNENLDSPTNEFDMPSQRKIEIMGNKKARLHLNQRESFQQSNPNLPKRNPLSKRKYEQAEDERNDDYKGRLRDRNKIKEKEEFLLPSTKKMLEKQKAKEEAEKECCSNSITIPENMSKRDYSDYVMDLHPKQDDLSLKHTQVGDSHQAVIPLLKLRNEDQGIRRLPKLVWTPEDQDEEKLAEYYKKIAEFIGETDINQERALKMFLRFKGETEKIIENIRKNRNHYTNYLKPILRNSKIS